MGNSGSILRVIALTLVAVAFWFVGRYATGMPTPLGAEAAPTEFSAARASDTLARLLGPEVPHPVSSPANDAVRERILKEFAALGVETQIYTGFGCNGRARFGYFGCGTVKDVIATIAPGEGKAIILLAHYDSVPAGPGAADDQSGVATVLETVRALKAGHLTSKHPIIALITDGEEAGLLGAAAFVDDPKWRERVGVVVNVEARGNNGPSLLFQTSPGDSKLIDLYARNMPSGETSSLFAVIYKALPNDTDLTVFLNKGLTGINFAFSGNVAHYHTPLDTRAHLDLSTLQMHGNNMLGIVTGLMQTDYDALKGDDAIYVTLFGTVIPRLPAGWALPLAILTAVLLIAAAFLSRGEVLGWGRRIAAASIPLLALIGAAAIGWLLHTVASLVSGQPDPSYAYPVWLRISLALGVLGVVLFVSRLSTARLAALSVWGWYVVLALATAAFLTGLSPYFLFPALIATPLLLAHARSTAAWSGALGEAVLFVAALLPLLLLVGLSATGESVQGLVIHPLFTVPAVLGAMTLIPLLASRPLARQTWMMLSGGALGLALVLAIVAGLQPAYSAIAPQRLNLTFVDDHVANQGRWTIETSAPVPKGLRDVMPFSDKPEEVSPVAYQRAFTGPGGPTRFAAPTADVTSTPNGAGRIVTLKLHGSERADRMVIVLPKGTGMTSAQINDSAPFVPDTGASNPRGGVYLGCVTSDCRHATVKLTFASKAPVEITIGEQRYSLPEDGAKLVAARPDTATRSQSGDTTVVFGKLKI